jgi:hypothetical protein
MGPDGAKELAETIKFFGNVETLRLGWCKLGVKGETSLTAKRSTVKGEFSKLSKKKGWGTGGQRLRQNGRLKGVFSKAVGYLAPSARS